MPGYWLLKTEPSDYSYDDLERDEKTIWDGVANNLALKHLRNIKTGDFAFIYHTGKERALVGIAKVISNPYPDPVQKDPRLVVVDVKAEQKLNRTVCLKEVKADPTFDDFLLVRLPRLSIMPITVPQWKRLLVMAES
ncbi:MAG: EVE domain-containing protein [Acidobacteriota bacterium]|nr:EVE domain-containing protein [Acidobacteriota bacterium]